MQNGYLIRMNTESYLKRLNHETNPILFRSADIGKIRYNNFDSVCGIVIIRTGNGN